MNRLLLASRTIRVQSSSPFKCAFNRSLSTTSCRKFRSTGAVSKRSRIHAVPDAFFGGEEEPIELPNEPESMFSKLHMAFSSHPQQLQRHCRRHGIRKNPVRNHVGWFREATAYFVAAEASPDFLAAEASPAPKTSAAPESEDIFPWHGMILMDCHVAREPLPTHTLELFNPNTYLISWSDKVAHAALASRGTLPSKYVVFKLIFL